MFGNNLKAFRLRAGLTQREIAEKLHMTYQSYAAYEKGKASPSTDTLAILCELLGVTFEQLKGEEVAMPVGIEKLPKFVKVPIIGQTHCGDPILAIEESDPEQIDVPAEYEGCVAFRAVGDSMSGAHIYNGDIVFVRPQQSANNGDIVLVTIEDDNGEYEGCLKKYFNYGNMLILRPENADYKEMIYEKEEMNRVHIVGIAIAELHALRHS